jgi:hypothetical protein
MHEDVIADILAAHADHLVRNQSRNEDYLSLLCDYRAELVPLLQIAERVRAKLVPVAPSPAFEAGLRQDLLAAARQRTEEPRVPFLRRKGIIIGAAAVGSVLSVAGIVAALLWRQRSIARAPHAT